MATGVTLSCTWHCTRAAMSSEQSERDSENRLEKRKYFVRSSELVYKLKAKCDCYSRRRVTTATNLQALP